MPIAFFRIEGGYGIQPRWSDKVRKGKMRAFVSRVVEPEEFLKMDDVALNELINTELFVDETTLGGQFTCENPAEYLERVLYVCPHCGLTSFYSEKHKVTCLKCKKSATYNSDKTFTGDFGFKYVKEWYDYQQSFVRSLNLDKYLDKPAFTDKARLFSVILYKKKRKLFESANLSLFGDRISVVSDTGENLNLPFSAMTGVSVLGRNKLNVYIDGKVYQFKGDKRFNAVKYVNFYYVYKFNKENFGDGQFLGL